MTFRNGRIVVLLLVILGFISATCGGVTVSVATGDATGCSGYVESFGANINDKIQESTILFGSSLSQSFSGSGDRAQTFSVTNNLNDHAEVGFDIRNSKSYSGRYTLSPQTAGYAQATEKLNVETADSIHAFANANSRDGNTAGSGVDVTKGSLIGFSNSAYASLGNAKTKQSWIEASGDVVTLACVAGNSEGDTARAIINNGELDDIIGSIKTFSNSAEAKKSIVSATQSAKSILGNYYIDAIGQNQLFNSAGTFAVIQGMTTNHKSAATATKDNTNAKFSAREIAGQGSIWTDSYIDYTSPDVMTSASIGWENAKIKGYSNEAKTKITEDHSTGNKGFQIDGSQKIGYASVGAIRTGSNAQSLEGCKSSTQTEMVSGFLQGYSDYALALKKPSLTSLSNSATSVIIKSASGNSIATNSNAENLGGDKSTTTAQLTDGTISGFLSTATATPYEAYGKEKLTANAQTFKGLSRAISRPDTEGTGVFAEPSTVLYRRGSIDYQTEATASQDLALASQEITCKMISNGAILSQVYTSDYTSPPFTPVSLNANIWSNAESYGSSLEAGRGSGIPAMYYMGGIAYPPNDPVEQKTNLRQETTIKQSVSNNRDEAVIDSNIKAPINLAGYLYAMCWPRDCTPLDESFNIGSYSLHHVHIEPPKLP